MGKRKAAWTRSWRSCRDGPCPKTSGDPCGEVWWTELSEPVASEPGYRRPVLIVQADEFNRSRIRTVIAAVLTTNIRLAAAPGNVLVAAEETGLPRDSVVNVSQVVAVDKSFLAEWAGLVGGRVMLALEDGLRTVLAL